LKIPLADVMILFSSDGLTLAPEQTPLILLIFPGACSFTARRNFTNGTLKSTSPAPAGLNPLLLTLSKISPWIWKCLRIWRVQFAKESTEISISSFVMPLSFTLSLLFPNSESTINGSKKYVMHLSSPHSKSNSVPSLLVIIPG